MIREHGKLLSSAILRVPAPRLAVLVALMVMAALTEGIGILLMIPLLADLDGSSLDLAGLPVMIAQLLPSGLEARLLLFIGLIALRAAIVHWLTTARARLQLEFVDQIRRASYQAMAMAEWRWLANKRVADRNAALLANAATAGVGLDQLIGLIASATQVVTLLLVSLMLSWQATLLAAVCGAMILVLLRSIRAQAFGDGQAIGDAQRDMYRQFEHGLGALRDVKMHGDQARLISGFELTLANLRQAKQANQSRNSVSAALAQTFGATALALLTYAGLRISEMPLATLVPQLILIARVFPGVERVQQGWAQVLHALPALAELDGLEAAALRHREPDPAGVRAPELQREIMLENVTVSYPDRDAAALDQVTLCIPAFSVTVITGPSGAGKSTMADVVAGLVVPDQGQLLIDAAALAPAARGPWRQKVAYVEQSPLFMHGSVRENLTRGLTDPSDGQLLDALDRASAGFVRDLPQGLATVIGDAGVKLSGGERQRLALARALLGRPQILILDEATSALDQDNETAVISALSRLRGSMTLILISHRPAMLALADQVYEMANGRLRTIGA